MGSDSSASYQSQSSSYFSLSEEDRVTYQFHWSIVYEVGDRPGAEIDQNIVNLIPGGTSKHNQKATLDQRERYSIVRESRPNYGNLKILNLHPDDGKLFLCQYGRSMTPGKLVQVNVT